MFCPIDVAKYEYLVDATILPTIDVTASSLLLDIKFPCPTSAAPNYLVDRDGNPILDRDGNYILVGR